ncbi:MAG TPA: class I SAM-dependent methyltransferase [Ktedonobacterales bacterium]|nr:class I SAM-dependent methyltransferase [Ktedonobacterales bacterium]
MSGASASGSLSFDPVAHVYDDTRGYPPGVGEAIADALMRFGPIATGAETLEIGVGTGRIALPLLERGVNVTGIDISERMIERLRAKYATERAARPAAPLGRLTVEQGDITALPFASAAFDAVVAVHVLHLVSQWRQAFDEALRALRPGAPLLLGQDVAHGSYVTHPLQDEWVEIMRSLGAQPHRLGAVSFKEILAEARGRGLRVEERLVADWTAAHTPAEGFSDIANRVWSLTWLAPDDLFAESVRRLEVWARDHFGDQWETPVETEYSFKLARVTAPER